MRHSSHRQSHAAALSHANRTYVRVPCSCQWAAEAPVLWTHCKDNLFAPVQRQCCQRTCESTPQLDCLPRHRACLCVTVGSLCLLLHSRPPQPWGSRLTGCTAVSCWSRRASWWCQVGGHYQATCAWDGFNRGRSHCCFPGGARNPESIGVLNSHPGPCCCQTWLATAAHHKSIRLLGWSSRSLLTQHDPPYRVSPTACRQAFMLLATACTASPRWRHSPTSRMLSVSSCHSSLWHTAGGCLPSASSRALRSPR